MGKKERQEKAPRKQGEIKGLILLALAFIFSLSFLSFSQGHPEKNWLGYVGYGAAWTMTFLLGLGAVGLIYYLGWTGWRNLISKPLPKDKTIYFFLFLISCCILLNAFAEWGLAYADFFSEKIYSESIYFSFPYPHHQLRRNMGGVPLYYLYRDFSTFNLQQLFSDIGIAITDR